MRVFTLLLMLTVALVGTLGGFRLITGKDLVSLSDFGLGPSVEPTRVLVAPPRTPTATAAPLPTAVPSPAATSTAVANQLRVMVVGNTGGSGVYTRKTPKLEDKLRAWVDGTAMEITGQLDADGLKWMKVRSPDGAEAYVPAQYLLTRP